jgi:hypothetical protein
MNGVGLWLVVRRILGTASSMCPYSMFSCANGPQDQTSYRGFMQGLVMYYVHYQSIVDGLSKFLCLLGYASNDSRHAFSSEYEAWEPA